MTHRPRSLWCKVLSLLLLLAHLSSAQTDAAEPPSPSITFDIPEGDALTSFRHFISQSGAQLLYSVEDVERVRTKSVQGEYPPLEALQRMLTDTQLEATRDSRSGTLTIRLPRVRPPTRAPETGRFSSRLSGRVSNAVTGAFLQGAVVDIPALQRQTLTNVLGEFTFTELPPGLLQITVSYTGLDTQSQSASLGSGETHRLTFELSSTVYQLEQFKVTGEREGNAASITRQRNAESVKSVVSVDAFGNLPNEGVGELLIRLPGVAGVFDAQETVNAVSIRGTPAGLNTVSVDGNLQASNSGFGRDFRVAYLSGALFEELEVNKAPTPDMPADSLGGAVNLKTRSSLNMKEKRRFTYRTAARWAPPFYDHLPLRRDHPVHPLVSLGYQELFGIMGQERNLGISLNAFYSENVAGYFQTIKDYEYTTASPAYIWDYRTSDVLINRKQASLNLKLDFKLSDHTQIYVNGMYNDAPTPHNEQYVMRAFTSRNVAAIGANGQPTGNGAILPGYTEDFTQVRGVTASTVQLNSIHYNFLARERQINGGVKHQWDRWNIDYDAAYSQSHTNLGNSSHNDNASGVFTMQVTGVGWTLDKSASAAYPRFTQTEGRNIYDGSSYTNGVMTSRDNKRNSEIFNVSGNVKYTLPSRFSPVLQSGFRIREQEVSEIVLNDRRWSYVGTAPLSTLVTPGFITSDGLRTGNALPFVNGSYVTSHIRANPTSWNEDHYYREMRRLAGTRSVTETISAGYLQARMKLDALSILAGARFEHSEVESSGNVISRQQSTAAQRVANPIGSAKSDYTPRKLNGNYQRWFPGVHTVYRFTNRLQARASWSNSVGRPPMATLLPLETANVNQETLTINNPALKPQLSENWDAMLEYYFEPVGQLSAGFFRKDIKDFIVRSPFGTVGVGADNGYNGDYAGYTLISQFNGGNAVIEGWELNYSQQLSFLPGALRGLGVFANYTRLTTEGNYGGEASLGTNEVADFVPETANAGVTFSHRRISARLNSNYTGTFLDTYNVDRSRLLYRKGRWIHNLNLSYRINSFLSLSCDIVNVLNEPQQLYRYLPSRQGTYTVNGTTVTFSVGGRF